jgi:hypothetical protein
MAGFPVGRMGNRSGRSEAQSPLQGRFFCPRIVTVGRDWGLKKNAPSRRCRSQTGIGPHLNWTLGLYLISMPNISAHPICQRGTRTFIRQSCGLGKASLGFVLFSLFDVLIVCI